jgi:hypothetical protein
MAPNSPLINGLGGAAGFGENALPRNDDSSSSFIDVRSIFENGLNFFGNSYNGFYINNNGNITFRSAQSIFTPYAITANTSQPIIAPFFADVDTRSQSLMLSAEGTSTGSNLVYWDLDPTANRMIITWDDVGQFSNGTTPNAFQLVLTDTANGNFNMGTSKNMLLQRINGHEKAAIRRHCNRTPHDVYSNTSLGSWLNAWCFHDATAT